MALNVTIELSDSDLNHFQEALRRAQEAVGSKSVKEITDAAGQVIIDAAKVKVPAFIAERLGKLDSLIKMVHDAGWALGDDDKKRVLTALTYFADPKDVIPDTVPVVGYLDDAIMIELCVRELKHELEAYEDFVTFVKSEAAQRGMDPAKVARADWLEERRRELQERMDRRRKRDGYTGPGQGGSVFRFR